MADGQVCVAVSDNGPGIPPDKLASIFDPYFTTKSEGSGLGLWIAQQIVTAHGGTLQARNGASGGAVLTMRLPLRREEAKRCEQRRREGTKRMDKSKVKILVVDDEQGLCAGVQEALRREGYVVDATTDAPAALKLTEQRLYNLVISDIKMPGLERPGAAGAGAGAQPGHAVHPDDGLRDGGERGGGDEAGRLRLPAQAD